MKWKECFMKIEKQILDRILKGEEYRIAGGEIIVRTKLTKVVSGIEIYDVELERLNDKFETESKVFSTVDELVSYAESNPDGHDLRACAFCGLLPENGYYINHDTGACFCSYGCLENYMNETFGFGEWTSMLVDNGAFSVDVKITEEEAGTLENCKKINGVYWKHLNIEYVNHVRYEDEPEFNDSDFVNIELFDDVTI